MSDPFFILMPLLFVLLPVTFLCFLYPIVGRLVFSIAAAWWWPFRKESAATLIAAAIDLDTDTTQWRVTGYRDDTLANNAMRAEVKDHWHEGLSLTINGERIPLTPWDTFKLTWATIRWDFRETKKLRKAGAQAAARAVKETAERLKAAQEKAR